MLEISILCVIALAAVYWMALWLMGRHEDVLYGSFVSSGPAGDEPAEPIRPILPPELPRRPRAVLPAPRGLPSPSVTSISLADQVQPPPAAGGLVNGGGAIRTPHVAVVSTARPPSAPSPVVPVAAMPMPPIGPTREPLAVNPAALQSNRTASAAPATHEPSTGDVLASLLETLKRDLSEAARK